MAKNLKLNPSPFIPATISLPSKHLRLQGVAGDQPMFYKFRRGAVTVVEDAVDAAMLLRLTKRIPGPGNIGSMVVPLVLESTADERVAAMTTEQKLDLLLNKLTAKGVKLENLLDDDDEVPVAVEPAPVADELDDDL